MRSRNRPKVFIRLALLGGLGHFVGLGIQEHGGAAKLSDRRPRLTQGPAPRYLPQVLLYAPGTAVIDNSTFGMSLLT